MLPLEALDVGSDPRCSRIPFTQLLSQSARPDHCNAGTQGGQGSGHLFRQAVWCDLVDHTFGGTGEITAKVKVGHKEGIGGGEKAVGVAEQAIVDEVVSLTSLGIGEDNGIFIVGRPAGKLAKE